MKNYAHCKENLFSRADLSGTTCNIEANILNLYIIAFPEGSHQLLIFSLRLYRGGHKWSGEYLEVQQKYFANISSSSSSMTFGTQAESPTPPYYFYNLETLHTFPLLEEFANAIPVLLTFI